MKLLLTVTLALFGNLALAFSCPDLGGKYLCKRTVGNEVTTQKINIIQSTSLGQPSYLIKDNDGTILFRMLADGKAKKTFDNINNDDVYTTSYCATESVSAALVSVATDGESSSFRTLDLYKNKKDKMVMKYLIYMSGTVNFIKADFDCALLKR